MKRLIRFSLLMLFVALCSVGTAHAQFNSFPTSSTVDIALNPANPGPNQNVHATASSFSTNINAATIVWKVNGKTVQQGIGSTSFSFITGDAGKSTTLEVIIQPNGGGDPIEKTLAIKPAQVDLLWQATGYVPPFYKGKVLFSHQDRIQFVAIPHIADSSGKEISPKNLLYTWTRNGSVSGDFSGYGKDTYTVDASIISRPLDVSVEVTSPNGEGVADAEIVAEPIEPSILLYNKDPLYGIQFQKALVNTVSMNTSKEIEVLAEPYYFGVVRPDAADLSYSWYINGDNIDTNKTSTSRVFRQKEGTSGASDISVQIKDASKVLQFSSGDFNLIFGQSTSQQASF